MKTTQIILPCSPLAATRQTVTGWVSRDGFFYGDGDSNERTARYAGSTHSECRECGAVCSKNYTLCNSCKATTDAAAYAALPRAPWGGQMLYSEARDEYFNEVGDAIDALDDGQTLADLWLVLCEPQKPPLLEEDFFADCLPEDGNWNNLPKELQDAADAFNIVASEVKPFAWYPSKVALDLTGLGAAK